MSVQVLELKTAVSSASVLRLVKAPLKVPAWCVVTVLALAGLYGYAAGRQNPVHHYVPYVGYPLVLDTTTGKACYSTAPKPTDDGSAVYASTDLSGAQAGIDSPKGPAIPMCGK